MLVFDVPQAVLRRSTSMVREKSSERRRNGHLLLFLYRLSYRNLQLLAFPMRILNPFCSEQILLWSARLLWGSAGG